MKKLTELGQFYGSENFYRHGLNRSVVFTDGAKYVADEGGAYWLLDSIAIANMLNRKVKAQEFQVWNLAVDNSHTALLECEDGNDKQVYAERIPFTDFPEEGVTLWFENNTIMLPSER